VEYIKTFLTKSFIAGNAGDFFRRSIESGDVFIQVNGEDTIRNTVQNNFHLVITF
jgi:hypothetical protein